MKYDSELFPDKLNVMLPLRRTNPMDIFEEVESEVRLYCRIFPTVFDKACGSFLYDIDGKRYLDFFSGAGALNYGHNNPFLMKAIVNYISNNGITHALDMSTMAKKEFLTTFKQEILNPRGLDYKVMFCGSTGTNAVEASLKLARKVKDRNTIFAFSGSFHGMSLGSLSVTSNKLSRTDLMGSLHSVVFMPFPYDFNMCFDTIEYIRNTLEDDHSGVNIPAAIILETVQAEGGVIIAPSEWLYKLRKLCDEYDILLICDDIQVGCYRTGNFFSFERVDIVPDMVVLSKSISGFGLPMSLLLMKPELDLWKPGEHNGTFRGNQLAFVAGEAALQFARNVDLSQQVKKKEEIIKIFISDQILPQNPDLTFRGIGLIYGIDFSKIEKDKINKNTTCEKIVMECFRSGLIAECSGRNKTVLKILPPLIIEEEYLKAGLEIIMQAIKKVI